MGDAAPQFFRAAEYGVLFLQVGRDERHGVQVFILVITDDSVLGAQIHQGGHMGAARRTVEDDCAAVTEADRTPYAGHGTAAGTIFGKQPFCC